MCTVTLQCDGDVDTSLNYFRLTTALHNFTTRTTSTQTESNNSGSSAVLPDCSANLRTSSKMSIPPLMSILLTTVILASCFQLVFSVYDDDDDLRSNVNPELKCTLDNDTTIFRWCLNHPCSDIRGAGGRLTPYCKCGQTSGGHNLTGLRCERIDVGDPPIDVNQCRTSNRCVNGGTCIRRRYRHPGVTYTWREWYARPMYWEFCVCPPGFTGLRCENQRCDASYCVNGGTCREWEFNGRVTPICQCPICYTNTRCQQVDQEYVLSLLSNSSETAETASGCLNVVG